MSDFLAALEESQTGDISHSKVPDHVLEKGSKWHGRPELSDPFMVLYAGVHSDEKLKYPTTNTTKCTVRHNDAIKNKDKEITSYRFLLLCFTWNDEMCAKCTFFVKASKKPGDTFCTIIDLNLVHTTCGDRQRSYGIKASILSSMSAFLNTLQLTRGANFIKVITLLCVCCNQQVSHTNVYLILFWQGHIHKSVVESLQKEGTVTLSRSQIGRVLRKRSGDDWGPQVVEYCEMIDWILRCVKL